jgi:hypothetical protein
MQKHEELKNWWAEFQHVMSENVLNPEIRFKSPEILEMEFRQTPYSFDPSRKTRTYKEVQRDLNAACSEAAAAIGASLMLSGRPFNLCVKKDPLTGSAHVTIIEGRKVFDPYRAFFERSINGCAVKTEFLPIR